MTDLWVTGPNEGGGKPPWACIIDHPLPDCVNFRERFFLRSIYDCEGRAQGGLAKIKCTLRLEEGGKTVTIKGYGFPSTAPSKGLSVVNDIRTIEMMAAGCCPPQIIEAILEGI